MAAAPSRVGAVGTAGDEHVMTIDQFEGEVPFAAPPQAGIFTFGGDADDNPRLSLAAGRGGHVLHGEYDINNYGGVVHDISYDTSPQDWSTFKGIRFWFYGQNTAPLPPGSGPRFFFEIKDGGANAEASELWNTSFTDDFQGWTLIEIPFSQLVFRTDYQPVGGIDHVLGLTQMWGYALTMPVAHPGVFEVDDVQVYGIADAPPKALVSTDRPVYPTDPGGSVTVGVTVRTPSGKPFEAPVTVHYATGTGSAEPADYTPVSGDFTLPAGTASPATQTFRVATAANRPAATARTVPIVLTSTDAAVTGDAATVVINAHGLPYLDRRLPVDRRVQDLLSRMTLDEKIGQMTQAERNALRHQSDIGDAYLGSLLSGGGSVPTPNTPTAWADMIDGYQLRTRPTRLQIPLIYGVDAVHGHNNVVGATLFPHNTGLGATRDPALVARVGAVTGKEVKATGIPWDFAPCLCVSRDERWGRAYESFGEDPALVSRMVTFLDGLQAEGVQGTAKHFVGDGGTAYGSSTTGDYKIDQGVTTASPEQLRAVHIAPFEVAVKHGVGSVMPSYSSVDLLDGRGPVKMHARADLITGVLKDKMGFDGFVISDWEAIDQIPGDYASDVRTSVNAGLDMIMVPNRYPEFIATLRAEVTAGRIAASRIDDAVARILRQKFRLGLFEKPYADRSGIADVGSPAHRAVARQAAAESQVLLKNDGNLLPLRRDARLYVAGSNADDLGNQLGGWSVTWQGGSGATTTGTTILGGINGYAPHVTYSRDASAPTDGHDVGVVVVGERPYAEGLGDVGVGGHDLSLTAADRAAVDKVCAAMKCVVLVVSGRPLLLTDQLSKINALVASWLPGTEGGGVADTLFGARPYTGRLPVSWPRSLDQVPVNVGDRTYDPLFPYGWGLRTDPPRDRLIAARDQLLGARGDGAALVAAITVDLARRSLERGDKRGTLFWLALAGRALTRTPAGTYALNDSVVSVARDIAQAGGPSTGTAGLTADADHALLIDRPDTAVLLLAEAYHRTT